MNIPENLLYTDEHEWVKIDDNLATIGITDYAQGELGDIVFIEFPDLDLMIAGNVANTCVYDPDDKSTVEESRKKFEEQVQ